MPRRALVSLLVASAAWIGAEGVQAQAGPSAVSDATTSTITGPDLPLPIALALQDELQFLDPPPIDEAADPATAGRASIELLRMPPTAFDPLYTVTSQLWPDSGLTVGLVDLDMVALYDPALGVARVEGPSGAAWLRLEPLRMSILERYIVLGRKGVLEAEPTVLEVLFESRRNRMGGSIIIDGHEIGPGRWDARLLWTEVAQAEAIDVRPFHFASHPSYPSTRAVSEAGGVEPVVFGAVDPALGYGRLDPAASPAPGDTVLSFRLRSGQEITFFYVAATGMLIDVTALERDPQARFESLPAFEMTSEFRTLVNRLVATGGVAIEDSGLRLGDVFETTGGPWPPPGWQPPPGARGLRAPTPAPESWLNHRVAAGVRPLDGEALHFAAFTTAGLIAVALAGFVKHRR